MIGAKEAGATVFLSPPSNCKEALRTKPDGLRLVKARTLTAAVKALDTIREGRSSYPRC
jgi:PDZ domain-containing protein